jgi:serine/threonine protein kinase/Tol biopolymer transport system component
VNPPDRFAHIESLYHAARARTLAERSAFLEAACAGDVELRREVESLLAQPETGRGLLDMPPGADGRVSSVGTPNLTGRQFGAYEVRAAIGAGGMGEVYRARDPKLGRDVAIKILPTAFSSDPDRRARFDREARVLAALNHPHIGAIYGVEESDGIRALVLELVDGETLAERIARGPIPIDEALTIAQQITDAIDAAHEKGIVHRDLKPANIKITPGGIVKVLDFGLAKTAIGDGSGPDLTRSPTITSGGTRDGVLLGTAAYMSPEQARGKTSDKRSDVWAFGCVLYEMLTGQVAFAGDTLSDTIAAILSREPDWSALPAVTPAPIRRLLIRCVEKEARRRLRDIGDARTEIEDVLSGAATPAPLTSTIAPTTTSDAQLVAALLRRYRGRLILATAVVLAAIAAVLLRPAAPEKVRRNEITPPDGSSFAPLMEGGAPALSPDGTKIAFVLAAQGRSERSLWVQSRDAFDAKPVRGTEGAAAPFWSPDGDEIAFFAEGALKTVKPDGGAPRVLSPVLPFTSQGALSGSWNSEGTLLFRYRNETLWSVSSKGGEATIATERNAAALEQDHYSAVFLPDGRHLILLIRTGAELRLEVAVGDIGSNMRKPLLKDVTNAQYAPGRNGRSGHLVFARGGRLIAQPFDEKQLKLTGSERTLAEDVAVTLGGGLADFSVSAGGVLAYRRAAAGPQQDMAWYDRSTGQRTGTLGDRRGHPRNIVRFSPSGKSVAFTRQGPLTQEVWIADVASGYFQQLTPNGRSPVWSPDESEVAFLRQDVRDKSDLPTYTIYRQKVDNRGEVAVWSRAGIMAINDWSGDGQYMLLTIFETTKPRAESWLLPNPLNPSATREPVRVETSKGHPQFVPSQGPPRWITTDGVVVQGMPGAKPGSWQVGSAAANHPRWRWDGLELFFNDDRFLQVVERVKSETDFKFRGPPQRLFPLPFAFQIAGGQMTPGWDVTPDGKRFLVVNPPPDMPTSIAIVTNWDVE